MRFQQSILLPLAAFAACCSTNATAERHLRSSDKQDESGGAPAVDLSKLQDMDRDEVKKQIRLVASKLTLPPNFTVDTMVELTMATLDKTKNDSKFAAKLQKQTGEMQKKMEEEGIEGIEDLGMGKKAGKEDETGGAK